MNSRFLVLFFLTLMESALAQDERPRMTAIRLNADEMITIDGRLDEASWSRV